jgi:hypothetical protein
MYDDRGKDFLHLKYFASTADTSMCAASIEERDPFEGSQKGKRQCEKESKLQGKWND